MKLLDEFSKVKKFKKRLDEIKVEIEQAQNLEDLKQTLIKYIDVLKDLL